MRLDDRLPELGLFLLGAVLRYSMHVSFAPEWGYDALLHWQVVRFVAATGTLPSADTLIEAFHPPLWYALAAALVRWGGDGVTVQWISIGAGIARLALVWLGLELLVPKRAARVAGLALAAVLPVQVHLDGIASNEALHCLLSAAALLLVPFTFDAAGKRKWVLAGALGAVLGLDLLAKVSASMLIAAIGIAVLAQLVREPAAPARERALRAAPWALVVMVPLLLNGWLWLRNAREFGRPFVSAFDTKTQRGAVANLEPRRASFFVGWDTAIYDRPYFTAGIDPAPHYFEVLTASTFVDYWSYSFNGVGPHRPATWVMNGRGVPAEVMTASVRSALGGTAIALATFVALLAGLRAAWRDRAFGRLALWLAPVLATALGLAFAARYPNDNYGVIKSTYVQFGAPPLYAAFGLAVAWTLERRRRWPLFAVLASSLWAVAAYTLYCRLRISLLPL